jgi:hypothetical protein
LGGLLLRLIPAAAGEFGRDMIVGTGAETVEAGAREPPWSTSGQTVRIVKMDDGYRLAG